MEYCYLFYGNNRSSSNNGDRGNDNSRKIMIFSSDGKFYDYRNASSDSSPSTYAASWTNGDVIGMLIDMDQAHQ